MAAGAWTPTNTTTLKIANGTFDFDSDTWLMALFTSSSNLGATSTTYAGVTNEVANGNGYTTGGESITLTTTTVNTDEVKIDISTDPVWTASGGSITARYAAIYESGGDIAFYCLLDNTPADVTVTDGNTLTVAAHTNGVANLAPA